MSASLDGARRARELEALAGGEAVDVVVVGGGITGAGVALDAASRGLSVALLERRDLAHGTSRWSSKLVHGGLRYLEHREWGLAWESACERARLMGAIAPHLVRPLPFVTPLGPGMPAAKAAKVQIGLRVGDGLRIGARTSRRVLPPARRISALEARRLAPALAETGLRGAMLSWDGQLEDDARLVVAVARTAAACGARIVTRAGVTGVRADGVDAVDELGGGPFSVRARHVVIATGVWAGELSSGVALRPSRGSHLLVPAGRLGDPRAAVNVPVPGERGRWVFALPRADGLVAIGLTDVPVSGPLPDEPQPAPAEEAELLAHASAALEVSLRPEDVAGRYAGLRPLLAGAAEATADLSRRHAVLEEPDTGALTVVGGKLTTYRAMAQDVVDRLTDVPCRTAALPLVGAQRGGEPPAAPPAVAARLLRRYGAEAPAVVAPAEERPELLEPVGPGVPVCGAELLWAVRHELALSAADLVDRRTRAGLVPEWREAALTAVARLGLAGDAPDRTHVPL
ncbi:MAG: glycerol-3-phosphate dehydrogenase [Solirubrobacteraceae bacterium]|nr:glycerol-3-phosphate dehydrogenase [Solirubrobacteraceae bacterium]